MPTPKLSVLFRKEEESWTAFTRRIRDAEGEVIAVLSLGDAQLLIAEGERESFISELAKLRYRVKLATKQPALAAAARKAGLRVFDRTRSLKKMIEHHPQAEEALRLFSPYLWRQQWRSRLQVMGLLSLPKIRIWFLIGLSVLLFLFVILRLLPSAEIRVWPRQDSLSQTTNVYLAGSGAASSLATRLRIMPLVPVAVTVHRSILYDQISKEFIGTDAQVSMTIFNKTTEPYRLKTGTRLVNQAGMVFKLLSIADIPAGGTISVKAKADHEDLYGEDIGDRGNVPAGLKWDFAGLDADLRKSIYAENKTPATGGKTASRKVLQQSDLTGPHGAVSHLQITLLAEAKQLVEQERQRRNLADPGVQLEFLTKDDVIKAEFTNIILPTAMIGKAADAVPIEGTLTYRMNAYDAKGLLAMLSADLASHVVEGKRLMSESLTTDRLKVYIIEFADDLTSIKLTAELAGTEEYVLDPLTPSGALFAKTVREKVAGLSMDDALRITRNLPEVEKAEISIWPPWGGTVPGILSHITISPQ